MDRLNANSRQVNFSRLRRALRPIPGVFSAVLLSLLLLSSFSLPIDFALAQSTKTRTSFDDDGYDAIDRAPAAVSSSEAPSASSSSSSTSASGSASGTSTSESESRLSGANTAAIQMQVPSSPRGMSHGRMVFAWKMGLGGESFANEKEQAQATGLSLASALRYTVAPGVIVKAKAGAKIQSGYAQSRFGENTPRNGLNLEEALVQYKPLSNLTFEAGAISQKHLNAPLLVSSRPFPGILEKALMGDRHFNVELKAQQAIPTSTTLSTRAVDSETSPSFFTETLTMKMEPSEGLRFTVFGSHFLWNDLPTSVAQESQFFGNTVDEPGPNSARFRYEFEGWIAGGSTRVPVAKNWAWILEGQMMQNVRAPETYKNAQVISTSLDIELPGRIELEPKASMFFAESDVAPAFYNSAEMGHNNRVGWAADLKARFKDKNFLIGAKYVDADTLNFDLIQSRQRYLMIELETLYDVL